MLAGNIGWMVDPGVSARHRIVSIAYNYSNKIYHYLHPTMMLDKFFADAAECRNAVPGNERSHHGKRLRSG